MLPRPRRVRRSDEFRIVVRRGVRAAQGTVVVHALLLDPGAGQDASERPASRVGFVVSRAVGGSVVRHRVVRRLRAVMARRLSELPDGLAIVVQALPAAARADSTQLERDLAVGLSRCVQRLGQRDAPGRRVSL